MQLLKSVIVLMLFVVAGLSAYSKDLNLKFAFDERDWVLAYKEDNSENQIMEFVLKSEKIESWSELVTVQQVRLQQPSTLKNYYQKYLADAKKFPPLQSIQSKIISQDKGGMLFEWWTRGQNAEHELYHFWIKENQIFILRYTTKKSDPAMLDKWIKILSQAQLTEAKPENTQGFETIKSELEGNVYIEEKGRFSMFVPKDWNVTKESAPKVPQFYIFFDPERKGSLVLSQPIKLDQLESFKKSMQDSIQCGKITGKESIKLLNGDVIEGDLYGPCQQRVGALRYFLVYKQQGGFSQPFLFSTKAETLTLFCQSSKRWFTLLSC